MAEPSNSSLHECDLLKTIGNQLQQKLSQDPFWPPQMQGSELCPQALPAAKRLGTYPHRLTDIQPDTWSRTVPWPTLTHLYFPCLSLFKPSGSITSSNICPSPYLFIVCLAVHLKHPTISYAQSLKSPSTIHNKSMSLYAMTLFSLQGDGIFCCLIFLWWVWYHGQWPQLSPQKGSGIARVYIHSKVEWSS